MNELLWETRAFGRLIELWRNEQFAVGVGRKPIVDGYVYILAFGFYTLEVG